MMSVIGKVESNSLQRRLFLCSKGSSFSSRLDPMTFPTKVKERRRKARLGDFTFRIGNRGLTWVWVKCNEVAQGFD